MTTKQTHEMLDRLVRLNISLEDAYQLRRISMTLQRWFELECGDGNNYGSWCITRGHKKGSEFTHDDDGLPYMEHHHYLHGRGKDYVTYTRLADREAGARRRLGRIMEKYPNLSAYIQTDPRGASLHIGENLTSDNYSSRGVAVYK